MILKLLLSILFFIVLPVFKLSSVKFRSKIIFAVFFIGFSFNNVQAQCNSGATAGVVSSNTDKICVGSTETFWSTGWGGGTWSSSNPSIVQITAAPNGNANVTGLAPGTVDIIYTITQSGCSEIKTAKKTITVFGALGATGDITGANLQCNGNTNQVYSVPPVTNAATYTWVVPSGWTIVSGQNTNSITTTIGSGSGNITLSVSNACKTNDLKYYYVNINGNKTAKPTITVTGSTSLCAGGTVTLTSSAQNSYLWSTGATTQSITVNSTGSYTVRTTQSGYCPSDLSNPVNVTVTPAPTFTASPASSVCANTNVTYTTESGKTNYAWSVPGTAGTDYTIVSGGIGTTSSTVTLQWKTGGNKTVTVNYNTGCAGLSPASNTTTVNTIAAGTASSSPQTCINSAITAITHSLSGVTALGTISSLPNGVNPVLSADKSTLTISGTPTQAGTFDYSITLSTACGNVTATGRITVASASVGGTVSSSQSICSGTQPAPISLAGNTGTIQWQVSTDNSTFTNINAATSSTLSSAQMGTLNATRYYQAVVTNGSCASAISSVATITIIKTDRGVTRGGKHICLGSANPTLTLYSYDLNNTVYPDANKVVKWQYSDDANNATYYDIPGTANMVTYTPPGTLTAFRTYRAVVQNGTCNTQNAIETRIDVDPLPTPTFTASAGAISCVGSDIVYTTQTGQNNYLWTVSGTLNTDYRIIAGTLATNSSTVTLRWLTAGNKTVTINYNNSDGCKAATPTSSTTDVRALPTTPTVGTINAATCTTAGSVNLTGLPAGAWTLTQSGTFANTLSGSGTSYTVSNLAAGNYTFTISNGSCTSVSTSNVQISDQTTATWNGTAWVGGVTPTVTKNVVFAGAYTVSADLEACSCTINSGVNVSVASGITLKITNAVNVAAGASLIFENNSSLVQVNNASVNTGNITYKRIAPKIRQADFVYWSTPVSPQSLYNVSQGTQYNMYMGFTGTNWQVTDRGSNMMIGKGYIIRGPQTYSNTSRADYQASFVGVPNNGNLSGETLDANKFYLIGNPYPSALDASKFLAGNLFLNGTLYFWTHNTPVVLGGAYQYNADDYAAFNLTGGVGTAASTGTGPGNNNTIPSGYIAAGQAFFASTANAGTVAFNNGMREGGTRNGQFFKPGKTSKEAETEKHRIWLNMTNEGGVFKQMLVGYVEGATNSQDTNYDGETFDGNVYLDFYSVNEDLKFAIQGRALPFADTDKVALGYRTTVAGDFTISIDQADGDLASHAVYIEDKTTGIIHDLKAGKFTFTTAKGTFTDRLVLRYTNKTLGTGDFENTENDLIVSVKNKVIKVNSAKESIKEISIFDITGKTLYTKNKIEATEFQISNLQSANQVLFIKTTLDNGYTVSKKIIFN